MDFIHLFGFLLQQINKYKVQILHQTFLIEKTAHKMLIKLKSVVNFTNILQTAFVPVFFCQKITKPNFNYRIATQKTSIQKSAHKMLMKLKPGQHGEEVSYSLDLLHR
jgi:hypothetical protein